MNNETFKLSNQALGTLMMSLQKCLLQQSDITVILKELDFYVDENNEIVCYNPPAVEFDDYEDDPDEYYEDEEEEEFSIPFPSPNGSIPWGQGADEKLTPEQTKEAHREYLEGWDYPADDEEYP
tara:strand:- start:723 stop:1094 length:372 start_codon:yes stop_codon:yes gene_type:complete